MRVCSKVAIVSVLAAAALMLLGGSASAQEAEETETPSNRGVITTKTVLISGRVNQPVAAIAVDRLTPSMALVELRQTLTGRIEAAIFTNPF